MNIKLRSAENFEFTPENMDWAKGQLSKYPDNRRESAVMPLLTRAQEQNNGWVSVPEGLDLPDNQQERDMIARELLIKFQMSPNHPMIELNKAYRKF